MTVIDEGDEEESDDEMCEDLKDPKLPIVFTANEVAQAFSHFTYHASGRKRLVCDLQGVYDEESNELRLSDPVIHYYNPNKADRRYVHGRTDKGSKGVEMFFDTHTCSPLCKLVLLGLRSANSRHKRICIRDS